MIYNRAAEDDTINIKKRIYIGIDIQQANCRNSIYKKLKQKSIN